MERITPLAAPTSSPEGPFRLSTHPGSGSIHDGITGKHRRSLCSRSLPGLCARERGRGAQGAGRGFGHAASTCANMEGSIYFQKDRIEFRFDVRRMRECGDHLRDGGRWWSVRTRWWKKIMHGEFKPAGNLEDWSTIDLRSKHCRFESLNLPPLWVSLVLIQNVQCLGCFERGSLATLYATSIVWRTEYVYAKDGSRWTCLLGNMRVCVALRSSAEDFALTKRTAWNISHKSVSKG